MGWIKKIKQSSATLLVLKSLALAGIIFFVTTGVSVLWAVTLDIPTFDSFQARDIFESTKIYDRTGKVVLYDVHGNVKRTIVPLSDIAKTVQDATVAIEDANFFEHKGVDPKGIARAFLVNLGAGSVRQGGSTITQQVIKMAILTSDRSITRKIKEVILAVKLERSMAKDDILAIYLNEAPYGGSIYGIEEASQSFFGKSARDLSLAESAYLAALPQAPSYLSPYGSHQDKLEERKNLVLQRMLDLGKISKEQFVQAKSEKITFNQRDDGGIKAPHFVDYVRSYLEEKYGRETIEQEGYSVVTTLDWRLQSRAQEIVAKYAAENETNFNAKNAGLVAIDPKTGQILAMVGSRNYFDRDNEGNFNITLAHRQPGSAFKPFAYATAFAKGYTPDTVLFDLFTEFDTSCNPDGTSKTGADGSSCYHPENYDSVFRGPVSMRNALAQSINIPSVKVMYLAGITDSIETAKAMGIKNLGNSNQYGLSLALGGGEVTLLELTSAYGVFANEGVRNQPAFILKIEDSKGRTVEEFTQNPKQVITVNVARQITDVLSDNVARTPAFGANSPLYFPGYDVAVKTGTTNDYKDAWILGYTPTISVGAWVGNNDNTPMEKRVARYIVAPLWNAFMSEALTVIPQESFTKPEATPTDIKPVLRGYWQGEGTVNIHSILYWVNKNNPLGARPIRPENDPQYILWETPIQKWVQQHRYINGSAITTAPISTTTASSTISQ